VDEQSAEWPWATAARTVVQRSASLWILWKQLKSFIPVVQQQTPNKPTKALTVVHVVFTLMNSIDVL